MNVTKITVEELIQYAHEASGSESSIDLLLGQKQARVLFIVLTSYAREQLELEIDFDWPEAYYSVDFFYALYSLIADSHHFDYLSNTLRSSNLQQDTQRAMLAHEAVRRLMLLES